MSLPAAPSADQISIAWLNNGGKQVLAEYMAFIKAIERTDIVVTNSATGKVTTFPLVVSARNATINITV